MAGAAQYLGELEAFLTNIAAYEEHRLATLRQQLTVRKQIIAELKKRRR